MNVSVEVIFDYETMKRFSIISEPFKIIGDVLVGETRDASFELECGEISKTINNNPTAGKVTIKARVVFNDMFSEKRTYLATYSRNVFAGTGRLISVEEI